MAREASAGLGSSLLEALDRASRNGQMLSPTVDEALRASGGAPAASRLTAAGSLEALAWCHALPHLAAVLDPEAWWTALAGLLETARVAAGAGLDVDPLVHQLLAGELAISLAYLFPELKTCRSAVGAGRRAVSAGLSRLLDPDGLPRLSEYEMLGPFAACWTRCRAMAARLAERCWDRDAEQRYRGLLRQLLRLVRPDGTLVMAGKDRAQTITPIIEAALGLAGDDVDRAIAAAVLEPPARAKMPSRARARTAVSSLPAPAFHAPSSALAVLRPGWSRAEACLALRYAGRDVHFELRWGRDVLWSGPCELEISADGRQLQPQRDWRPLRWVSDGQADYLELGAPLSEGFRIERHILLARKDRLLLLADAILGPNAARLDYRARLPLGNRVALLAADKTHEARLAIRDRRVLVLPLHLPEWRADPRPGALAKSGRSMELRLSVQGRAMLAPLLVDLDPRRRNRPFTWRWLTVGENLQAVPGHVAVGYRVLVGRRQWLVYRSLAPRANRTLLGHNTVSRWLVARFHPSGQVEPLVEVE